MPVPRIAIVGRPNVGKSSLVNMVARARIAIVDPTPGVTRDRVSTLVDLDGPGGEGDIQTVELTDTGGYGVYVAEGARYDEIEVPEAWVWGPVFRELYHAARMHGNSPISKPLSAATLESEFPRDCDELRAFLDGINAVYGRYGGSKLSNMTHLPGTPWAKVADRYNGALPRGVDIPDEYISEYFGELARNASQAMPPK